MAELQPRIVSIDADTMARVEAAMARDAAPTAPSPRGILGRVRDAVSGWMSPGQPVAIMVPVESQSPRAWDYPVGINRHTVPRVEEAVTPRELRFAAEDTMTRMAIETCKNRLERFGWEIKPRDPAQKFDPNDARIIEIRDQMRRPDGRLSFQTWLRKVLEDRYVLDAASVYIRRNRRGTPFAFEVLDGATIRPLFDASGRPPLEGPAYRQIIKGVPAVDLPAADFVHGMRNPRPHKPYGFSETEQLLLTINISIRRELAQLDYFTAGTIPDALYAVDKDFGGEAALAKFQARWDSLFGNGASQEQRRKLRFVPTGELKELMGKPLQDEFDEWLARKISYGFNLPALWAVKVMNRATANQAEDSSLYEGMIPDMLWVRGLIDQLIELGWGDAEYGFFWQDIKTPDPQVQAQVNMAYANAGILGIDEIRESLGRPKIGARPMVMTAAGPIVVGSIDPETGEGYPEDTPAAEDETANGDGTAGRLPGGAVQDTALNGAQITSLLEVAQKVGEGVLTPDAGVALIIVAFPTIDEREALRIVSGASKPAPAPTPPSPFGGGDPAPPPPDGGDPEAEDPEAGDETGEEDEQGDDDDDPPATAPKLQRIRTVAGLSKQARRVAAGKAINTKAAAAQRKALAGVILVALVATRDAIADQVTPLLTPLEQMRTSGALTRRQGTADAVGQLDMAPIEAARAAVAESLAASVAIGGKAGSKALQVLVPSADAFALDNAVVTAWAAQRAAALVGKKVLEDGRVIDNPNPRYAITESTREMVAATITKALDEGSTRPELVAELSKQYAFSKARADLIARTEVSRAVIAGNVLSWQESGLVTGKEWILGSEHSGADECDLNAAAGVIGVGEAFPSGDMEPPAHPGCVLPGTVVAAAGVTAHFARPYHGEVVTLCVEGVPELTLTPNHPVLTPCGWVPAGQLHQGDYLLHGADCRQAVEHVSPDDHQVPLPIEEVAGALLVAGGMTTAGMPVAAEDFHGDGGVHGEVDVVRAARTLRDHGQTGTKQRLAHGDLPVAHGRRVLLARQGDLAAMRAGLPLPADGIMRRGGPGGPLASTEAAHLNELRLGHGADPKAPAREQLAQRGAVAADPAGDADGGLATFVGGVNRGQPGVSESARDLVGAARVPDREPSLVEAALYHLVGDAESPSDTADGLAAHVRAVQLVEIRKDQFVGHVYNLSTAGGWYFAQGIIVHNCVCDVLPVVAEGVA